MNILKVTLSNPDSLTEIIKSYRSQTGLQLVQDAKDLVPLVREKFPTYTEVFTIATSIWLMIISNPKNYSYSEVMINMCSYYNALMSQGDNHPPIYHISKLPILVPEEVYTIVSDEIRANKE